MIYWWLVTDCLVAMPLTMYVTVQPLAYLQQDEKLRGMGGPTGKVYRPI